VSIYEDDLDLNKIDLSPKLIEILQSRYLEYPKDNKETEGVIERHCIGNACHFDIRFLVDDHLVGFSIVGFNRESDPDVKDLKVNENHRSETKAVQPVTWLFKNRKIGEEFEFKPGTVGAGVEKEGTMKILDRFKVIFGTLKPYFVEYFIKGEKNFKDWTRITFTSLKAKRLDPETKEPIGEFERIWIFKIPSDQMPYAISDRAMKKNYKPKEGIIPFPEEWTKEHYKEQYKKWLDYMSNKKEELSDIQYSFVVVSWMGARAKSGRNMPQFRYYLLLKDQSDSVMAYLVDGNLLYENTLTIFEFDRVSTKWLDYEGLISPDSVFNPNKEIQAKYTIISKGRVSYNKEIENEIEIIKLNFKSGLIKGKWIIKQDEKGSDIRTIEKLMIEEIKEELKRSEFVYHEHTIDGKTHWDIRFKNGTEYNLTDNLLDTNSTKAYRKMCYDIDKWWITSGERDLKVGSIITHVKHLDHGNVTIFNDTDNFSSYDFKGDLLKGLYVAIKEDGYYLFKKSELPGEEKLSEGDPNTGDYYDPFKIIDIKGRDTFRIELYDIKKFTRCELPSKAKEYIKDIPDGVSIGICLFPREGTLHGARVSYVIFKRDKWTIEQAIKWINDNKIYNFLSTMIRE